MILAVSPSNEALKGLQRHLFANHLFAHYAPLSHLQDAAALCRPDILLLLFCPSDAPLRASLADLKALYPSMAVIAIEREAPVKPCRRVDTLLVYPKRVAYKTLFAALYSYGKREDGSLLEKGVYLCPRKRRIALYGRKIPFSLAEASILRLLAEVAPRHLSAEDIARLASFPGEALSPSSIVSRISRLNACAKRYGGRTRRLVQKDEVGYYIAP